MFTTRPDQSKFERPRCVPLRAIRRLACALGLAIVCSPVAACDPATSEATPLPIDVERFRVDLANDDYALGSATPLVTIVLFSDYACLPCGRTWTILEQLQEDYGDDLRVVHRSATVPGFTQGESAAEAAFAAGAQGKFWEMHRRLFANPSDFSRPVLRAHAEALGLDVPRFMDELDEGAHAGRRARDRRQATALGIRALPAYFMNGVFLLSAPKGEEELRPIIDNELALARKMIAKGTARADLYAEIMSKAAVKSVTENDDAKQLRAERQAKQVAAAAPLKAPTHDRRYRLPVGGEAGAAAVGPADAPIVVVEFIDFQCPFCRKNAASIAALRERYPKQLRVELRHLPLEIHPSANGAARAAIAAQRQDRFWDVHDRLFAEGSSFGYESYLAHARELGLDVARFERDLADPSADAQIRGDIALARALGVGATPAVFVNGYYFEGLHSVETYAEVVERDLASAAQLSSQGVSAADLHAALMKDAAGPEQFPNVDTGTGGAPHEPPAAPVDTVPPTQDPSKTQEKEE